MSISSVRAAGLGLLIASLLVSACSGARPIPDGKASFSEVGDPIPEISKSYEVGSKGKTVDKPVRVEVPKGAVPEGHKITLGVGSPLGGRDDSKFEQFGSPVEVKHDAELEKPIKVSWDVSHLTDEQRSSLLLVRWNPDLRVWDVARENGTVQGEEFVAEVSEFSIIDWVSGGAATTTQVVGQWMGKRASAPKCKNQPTPNWVTKVVRPDEDEAAIPIRTCAEPDKDDVLTLRVANNRPYTQFLRVAQGEDYVWKWAGEQDYTVAGIIRESANEWLSDGKTLVMAPTRETAVGVGRPKKAGAVAVNIEAQPNASGIGVDVLVYVLGTVLNLDSVGGFDSKTLNTLVQTIYDCGGKKLLQSRDVTGSGVLGKALDVMKSCAKSDAVRSALKNTLRAQIAKGGESASKAIKTKRAIHQALGKLSLYISVMDFASYSAELTSSGAIGSAKISVFGRGTPPAVGEWSASCAAVKEDADKLYRNLLLQDEFAENRSRLGSLPSWKPSTTKAVKPLRKCSTAHIQAVAQDIEKTEGDAQANRILASSVRSLIKVDTPTMTDREVLDALLPANVCAVGESGWPHNQPIQLKGGRGEVTAPDGSFEGPAVQETKILGWADMDDDGKKEVVLAMVCSGCRTGCASQSGRLVTVGVFKPGKALKQVGSSLNGGVSGEADTAIRDVRLKGTSLLTEEFILYAGDYEPDQVGGDPYRSLSVTYHFKQGKWFRK